MAKQSLVKEFFYFIKHEKKWWLIPLIAVLLILGALVLFAGSSPMAPFLCPTRYPACLPAKGPPILGP